MLQADAVFDDVLQFCNAGNCRMSSALGLVLGVYCSMALSNDSSSSLALRPMSSHDFAVRLTIE